MIFYCKITYPVSFSDCLWTGQVILNKTW